MALRDRKGTQLFMYELRLFTDCEMIKNTFFNALSNYKEISCVDLSVKFREYLCKKL